MADLEGLTPEELRKGLEFETHNEFLDRIGAHTPEREKEADRLDGYTS